ncbi:MAG: GtrA family protein [Chitinophagaceae bacterium]|nr:MAG: GtrA family protein [Chitinophagaceae bacterium]
MILQHLLRLLKFGLVGLLGMVVDFGVTWLFKEKVRINRYVANALGFSCAVVLNFLLNRAWTFGSHAPNVQGQLVRFVAVSLVGLGLNTAIIYFLNHRKLNFYLSKAIAIVIVFFWNYGANAFFTFRPIP